MDRTVPPTEWKPQESTGNHWQASLGLVGEVPRAHTLDGPYVGRATFSGVLIEACKQSGLDDHEIADRIHISHGYMSKFMRGVAQQWAKRLVAFMRVTNSLAPLQWMADQMGCDVTARSVVSAELAAARARVAELERNGRYAA